MTEPASAHSKNEAGVRHELVDHLTSVAQYAAEFAKDFGGETAGYWVGLCHDIGKFNPAFQDYLTQCDGPLPHPPRGPDHQGAGALLAGGSLALVVQGHHGGLPARTGAPGWLADRREDPDVQRALDAAHAALPELATGPQAMDVPEAMRTNPLAAELWLRLLLSALIDADRLDTEAHFRPDTSALRGNPVSMAALYDHLATSQREFANVPTTPVNDVRAAVYDACLAAAAERPGLFRLTVPTGGGKTLF